MKEIIELWKNKKYRTLIKLTLWIIFIIIICALAIVSDTQKKIKNNQEAEKDVYFSKMILDLNYNKIKVDYELEEYIAQGIVENNIFTGSIKYKDGKTYNVKYENGNLIKDSDNPNDEYLLIHINSKYLLPAYLINLFNNNEAQIIEENKKIKYTIDNITYELEIINEYHYQIKINDNDIISFLDYEKIS